MNGQLSAAHLCMATNDLLLLFTGVSLLQISIRSGRLYETPDFKGGANKKLIMPRRFTIIQMSGETILGEMIWSEAIRGEMIVV